MSRDTGNAHRHPVSRRVKASPILSLRTYDSGRSTARCADIVSSEPHEVPRDPNCAAASWRPKHLNHAIRARVRGSQQNCFLSCPYSTTTCGDASTALVARRILTTSVTAKLLPISYRANFRCMVIRVELRHRQSASKGWARTEVQGIQHYAIVGRSIAI